jgi:hypothetical protein
MFASTLLASLLFVGSPALAAEGADPVVMLGGELGLTYEPAEVGGATFSVNALPVVVEWAASDRVGLRARTVLNLQLSGADTGLAHRGGGLTLPIYLSRDRAEAPYRGFYVGPYAGFTLNPLVDGSDLTLAAEGGVRWRLGERGMVNLDAQLGASHLERPESTRWVNHFGVFPSIGFWL